MEKKIEQEIQKRLSRMTLRQKILQMMFVVPEAIGLPVNATANRTLVHLAVRLHPVGGVIFYGRNLQNQTQIRQMTENFTSCHQGILLGIDEEGGQVSRLSPINEQIRLPLMNTYGTPEKRTEGRIIGQTLSTGLKQCGMNVNFAPVADVFTNPDNTFLARRCFSSDPETVAMLVQDIVHGHRENRIISCAKHFPGHGSTVGDPHEEIVRSGRTLKQLQECDLIPFEKAIEEKIPMIMAGHILFPEIDNEHPATLSKIILTDLLKKKMGFEGIVICDALRMKAIRKKSSAEEAAVQAILAGCDMLLGVDYLNKAIRVIKKAVKQGRISEQRIDESVARILKVKMEYGLTGGRQ